MALSACLAGIVAVIVMAESLQIALKMLHCRSGFQPIIVVAPIWVISTGLLVAIVIGFVLGYMLRWKAIVVGVTSIVICLLVAIGAQASLFNCHN
jgi:predicted Co/Zn/Cd cation transporter (cation efflux family)